jgi:hypothetical protein
MAQEYDEIQIDFAHSQLQPTVWLMVKEILELNVGTVLIHNS